MPVEITRTNGFMALDAWVMAHIVQLYNDEFCDRYVTSNPQARMPRPDAPCLYDPTGRQYDQMTQAARSAQANIAEGYARHQTSTATEMQLLDVARATLQELKGDYFHFLLRHGFTPWTRNDPDHLALSNVRLARADYGDDWDADAARHIMQQKELFAPWFQRDAITAARAMYVLCNRCIYMTERFIAFRLEEFRQNGGFKENLTQARNAELARQAERQENPRCPQCGAPMIMKTATKGARTGKRFWSCSQYSTTGCRGSINID